MEVKGIYRPEMVMSNAGRSYHIVVNLGSKQIDDETYDLVSTSIIMTREPEYDTIVSALIRKKYNADKMEAIINNYLADKNDEIAKLEFDEMQAYRREVKNFCKTVFDAIAESEQLKEMEKNPPLPEPVVVDTVVDDIAESMGGEDVEPMFNED